MKSSIETLQAAFDEGNVKVFLQSIQLLYREGLLYPQVVEELQKIVKPERSFEFAARGLEIVLPSSPSNPLPPPPSTAYLLLELVQPPRSTPLPPTIPPLLAASLSSSSLATHGKFGARLVEKYEISIDEFLATGATMTQLDQLIRDMLSSPGSCNAAVILLLQFGQPLLTHVNLDEVISSLVALHQDRPATRLVTSLSPQWQRHYIQLCINQGRLKPAVQAMRSLQLETDFPSLEDDYRIYKVRRLASKGLYQIAAQFANERNLRIELVRIMSQSGQATIAREYASSWGLTSDEVDIDPALLAKEDEVRRATYLQLDVPRERIVFVDSVQGLELAGRILRAAPYIGLDLEWKAAGGITLTGSTDDPAESDATVVASGADDAESMMTRLMAESANCASILQLATSSHAFLFDILALRNQPAFRDFIRGTIGNPSIVKLGFDMSQDVKKLIRSMDAVDWGVMGLVAGPLLDCRALYFKVGAMHRHANRTDLLPDLAKIHSNGTKDVGLSSACLAYLGRPLDKSMQMSDWEMRPLSERQVEYAAMDAHCLPPLFDAMRRQLESLEGQTMAGAKRQETSLADVVARVEVSDAGVGSVASIEMAQREATTGTDNATTSTVVPPRASRKRNVPAPIEVWDAASVVAGLCYSMNFGKSAGGLTSLASASEEDGSINAGSLRGGGQDGFSVRGMKRGMGISEALPSRRSHFSTLAAPMARPRWTMLPAMRPFSSMTPPRLASRPLFRSIHALCLLTRFL